ncbi:unnamed protein product [Linum trigynum]|uniref:F-box domain-containing protein n=1 Tax=Linum trigynum TaxID=586398 RepID=A0AAV2G0R8_9ROSI
METNRAEQREVRKPTRIDVDRLSSLPDEILSDILSLVSTKAAVRTTVLSRRWKHLWTRVSNLDLDNSPFSYFYDPSLAQLRSYRESKDSERCRKGLEFCRFVDKVLSEHTNLDSLRRFRLHVWEFYLNVRPNFWLKLELGPGSLLQEIDVNLHGSVPGTHFPMRRLPEIFFTLQHLRVLKLAGVIMVIGSSVFLPNVKILQLLGVKIVDGESFGRLISGCPALETAHLQSGCRGIDKHLYQNDIYKLVASSPCLKNLTIMFFDSCTLLEIEAPNLEHLRLEYFSPELLFLGSSKPPCLQSVSLAYGYEMSEVWDDCLSGFLSQISNAKEMSLSWQWIAGIEFREDFQLPVFPNLTHLKIETDPISCILLLFLNSTSSLQSLVISIVRDVDLDEGRDEASIVWVSDLAYRTPERPLSSLEEIEITDYKGGVHEFEMLAYLLEIGVAVKKFTVSVANHDLRACTTAKTTATGIECL